MYRMLGMSRWSSGLTVAKHQRTQRMPHRGIRQHMIEFDRSYIVCLNEVQWLGAVNAWNVERTDATVTSCGNH